ncbi:PREDICTED: choline monooxygenase [Prunus dulcis]|uniref:Choline monooxygenase, chloroplastic n=1 Tax=Prunus dulcis TaxID=3755 RepID=A0A5E4F6F7_PRUDU|nr:choline monooxygenase, chloroplastic [Prunus dulcis]VVA22231.1 PREDICTED: choline monooxygenase [Prunus dulcis]
MEMAMTVMNAATLQPKPLRPKGPYLLPNPRTVFNFKASSLHNPQVSSIGAPTLVGQFDPTIPIERAVTPPSSWYTDSSFYSLELDTLFYRGWQAAGYTEQIKNPGEFFTCRLGNAEFVVCRDGDGKLQAFHNVCRHHASLLAYGSGRKSCFVCPYHGWTYGLDGSLLKATRITGIQNFNEHEFGLISVKAATWGPFVLLNMEQDVDSDTDIVEKEWLGSSSELLSNNGVDSSLSFVCRRDYMIECNWKVFCDNYLDGGYHVPYAHKGLASGLNLDHYSTTIYEKVSIQKCEGGSTERTNDYDRLGSKALYAFVYPNFMINRYGPWMDTNLVLPLGPRKCQVIFDYFIEPSLMDNKDFIERSLKDSERVQVEDVVLCEGVQRGLESPAYDIGRYAPTVENAMHHFHCLLHKSLKK